MTKIRRALPWFIGLLLATGLFAGLQLFTYLRFENSDDILIVKSFMGFEGGVPATYNLYLHTVLSHFLGWLSTLAPGVAWFSLFQLFCLWFSTVVIVKCILQCAMSRQAQLWTGILLSLLFCGMVAAFACARINFTTTAAMLGAAATVQVISLRFHNTKLFLPTLLSVALLIGCYLLRPQSALAAAPFFCLALLWLILYRKQEKQPLTRGLIVPLVLGVFLFGGLYALRAIEERDPAIGELVAFQDANTAPMDYDDSVLQALSDDTLAQTGWSRAELALIRQWYFMDENITADAFNRLNDATVSSVSLSARVAQAFSTLVHFYAENTRYLTAAGWLLLLCLLCVLAHKRGTPLLLTAAASILCVLLTAAMLLFLAYQGRFLARAADCALIPAAAMLSCSCMMSMAGWSTQKGAKKIAVVAAIVLCLSMAGVNLLETKEVLSDRPDVVSATRESDLETYGLENPEMLILRTPDLLRDTRLLPDVKDGMAINLMIWGDWYCRTPSWYRQLELFGFDGRRFTATDFLRDNLLFATADLTPPQELLTYIEEEAGRPVVATLYGERGELRFFRFE
ncbi:MAG: hypothetical protein PHI98_00755 [Eubacteriales bacterium]|nr:hypothetical protein [Eubacteriales bacterium]